MIAGRLRQFLDEYEGDVPPEQVHGPSTASRSGAASPWPRALFNLILCVFLYGACTCSERAIACPTSAKPLALPRNPDCILATASCRSTASPDARGRMSIPNWSSRPSTIAMSSCPCNRTAAPARNPAAVEAAGRLRPDQPHRRHRTDPRWTYATVGGFADDSPPGGRPPPG